MLSDPDQIEAAFVGTALAGLPVGYGPAGTVLVVGVDPGGLHEAWQAAEALVPVTGRRPVMVTDEYDDAMAVLPEPEPGPAAAELDGFAEAARASEPWLRYRHYGEDDEVEEGERGYHARGVAGVDLTDLVADVPLPAPRPVLERAIYDRVLADAALHARVLDSVRFVTRTDYWYTPDVVLLMLVPTGDVRRSGYWVDFYGAIDEEEQAGLAEVLARWRDRWDARLVASWGTMLQFQVGRRPVAGDDAWAAAGQLKALAPNLELSRWEVAVAVADGDAWFVHNRP
ncbi:DUF4253 domain-containing protein [Dactylosporangium aurantiacum]|uniref:DUF4253 domain-containing protein n=1 Tax=Dactylosporangium aurantiacum TaxID=35754 RepID=A0A9Q9MHQ8_9ACTN|nr:DUF4253 domain-containing protein [Dactylosporangium aurantiacum]MDG6105643.1 DUF4253 domain-containing protein [Dactylosporangium aurantiacum]UWZ57024.1 DUF4253 domain-containing protein [Dactylosporangium aurantiacum]